MGAAFTGRSVPMHIGAIPTGSTAGALFVEFARRSLDLGLIGAPGRSLLTSVAQSLPFAVAGSTVGLDLGIPANSALIGLRFTVQAATINPGVNALGAAASNEVELRVREI